VDPAAFERVVGRVAAFAIRVDLPVTVVSWQEANIWRAALATGLATDLATEHGGTDANEPDAVRQGGRLNLADMQL